MTNIKTKKNINHNKKYKKMSKKKNKNQLIKISFNKTKNSS